MQCSSCQEHGTKRKSKTAPFLVEKLDNKSVLFASGQALQSRREKGREGWESSFSPSQGEKKKGGCLHLNSSLEVLKYQN